MTCLPIRRLAATCVVLAGAYAVSPGCSSGPDTKSTVDSMNTFALEVAKAKDTIDSTVTALGTVVASQPDAIKANADAYAKAVAALDEQAKVVRGRSDEMKAKGDEFFKDWEAPATVTPERRAELTACYGKIKTDMAAAREEFAPFLAALKDVDSYLKVDPSPKGINAMTGLVTRAKDTGTSVKARIDAVLLQLNSISGMLNTTPK
jgi:hypothetical protein